MPERTTSIEQEERHLVARVLKGDEAAQEELVRKHRERIYAVAVAFLGYQDPEAEDVVQETFAAGFLGLAKFEFRSSLYTWLNQICVRHCYKRIRVRSKTVLGLESGVAEALGHHTESEEAAAGVIRSQELTWLKQAIADMKELCRELLSERDLKGRSYGELSRHLKVPIGTVMSRLARCREDLRQRALKWQEGRRD